MKKLKTLMKKSDGGKFQIENEKLKSKLMELFTAYSDLYNHTKQLTNGSTNSESADKLDCSL
ncbi:hypothetical protein BLA29_014583, partial [Euroglyphus maynei]